MVTDVCGVAARLRSVFLRLRRGKNRLAPRLRRHLTVARRDLGSGLSDCHGTCAMLGLRTRSYGGRRRQLTILHGAGRGGTRELGKIVLSTIVTCKSLNGSNGGIVGLISDGLCAGGDGYIRVSRGLGRVFVSLILRRLRSL